MPSHARMTAASAGVSGTGGANGRRSSVPSTPTNGIRRGTSHGRSARGVLGHDGAHGPPLEVGDAGGERVPGAAGVMRMPGSSSIRDQPTGPKKPMVSFFAQ